MVFIISAVIAVLVGIDQLIKAWAVDNLRGMPPRSFCQIGDLDWMHLRYLENDGAAFSMLSGSRGFLIIFPIIMICTCLYVMHRHGKSHRWLYAAFPLIAAGGIGNLIDRLFRGGKVVDYFAFQLTNFAVFNFADCCVSVGIAIFVFAVLFLEKELPEADRLPNAKRLPYARTLAELPDADSLPEAETLRSAADAEILTEETDDAEP